MGSNGTFIVSLDFELHWGVRDKRSIEQYRSNLLGVRDAVPRLLDLFVRYDIHATWATVGLLFAESKQELLDSLPDQLPTYVDPVLSPYSDLDQLGENERSDPYHFAPSLISQVSAAPGQEIGTHTFSHYYCLEAGQTGEQFRADLNAAVALAGRRGIQLHSIVFPRNQVNHSYFSFCREFGFVAYRGNEEVWFYRAGDDASASQPVRRAARLLDSYLPLAGSMVYSLPQGPFPRNLPSSRFLRPYSPRFNSADSLRCRRILRELNCAARQHLTYHLWWHPHNFGVNLAENLAFLETILQYFQCMRVEHGMSSLSMCEAAQKAETS